MKSLIIVYLMVLIRILQMLKLRSLEDFYWQVYEFIR